MPESSLVRESNLVLMTRAGPEIGVASTKAFVTQLVSMLLLTLSVGKVRNLESSVIAAIVKELVELPRQVEKLLEFRRKNKRNRQKISSDKKDALFFRQRENTTPSRWKGALKLKRDFIYSRPKLILLGS